MELLPLNPNCYSLFRPYYEKMNLLASELNYTNLWMWRHKYRFHYLISHGFLWICNIKNESSYYFSQPIGDYKAIDSLIASIQDIQEFLGMLNIPLIIKKTDTNFVSLLSSLPFTVGVVEDPSSYDYIYSFEELLTLPGNKYHKKRNHINKFTKSVTEFNYIPLSVDSLPLLQRSYIHWFDNNERESSDDDFKEEAKAIKEALDSYSVLNFEGGMIVIDSRVEAYTLGERLNADTFLVHIEKANPSIPGLYPMIHQSFLQNLSSPYKWVNREQDLGIEGLRKAKLSYYPTHFIEKYILYFD